MYRLGDDLAVRLPRTAEWAGDLERERVWLPRLGERISLRVPEPVAEGRPTDEYPLPWAVYRWVDGDQYDDGLVDDEVAAADDLARFVRELRAGPVDGAPATGRRPLAELDEATRAAIVEAGDLLDTVRGPRRVGPRPRGTGLHGRHGLDPHRPAPPEPAGPRRPRSPP